MISQVEEIKSRLDIVEVVQGYMRLEKSGVNYRAVCPFHSEKTPSFFVNPARQIWHCFGGCAEGGDMFSFVMKIEGVEFPEALEILARKAGVELKKEDPRLVSERKRLYEICETAAVFFQNEFGKNQVAVNYMKERGVKEETMESFRVGFAPDGWRNLFQYLTQKGFKAEDIEKAGLVIKQDTKYNIQNTNYYDRFRSRIIFPITDASSRVIGFGGRIFDASAAPRNDADPTQTVAENFPRDSASSPRDSAASAGAKYINSPQTFLYDKSRVLYAFDKAKQEIRKQNFCILVEGYMDAIMSHQAGFANTIAVSGTALTQEQLRNLKRLTNVLISSFDSDKAGELATSRSLDLAGSYDFERKVAVIPKEMGKDPADVVKNYPEKWKEIIAKAENVMDFYIEKAVSSFDINSPSGKKGIAAAVLPKLALVSNEIERSFWLQKLAGILDVSESAVWEEFKKAAEEEVVESVSGAGDETIDRTSRKSRKQDLEEKMLGLLLLHPDKISLVSADFMDASYFSLPEAKAAYLFLQGRGHADENYNNHLKFRSEVFLEGAKDRAKAVDDEIKLCFREFLKESFKEKLGELSGKIKIAEKEQNQESLASLMTEFQELSQRFHSLN